ncbi:hypothetical protein Cs7R123_06620 [Catellatospora sp. TT07R-123]|nr:hypothetical protein Cs7R123_06620 [Catellatospora sp. TT07R-123]
MRGVEASLQRVDVAVGGDGGAADPVDAGALGRHVAIRVPRPGRRSSAHGDADDVPDPEGNGHRQGATGDRLATALGTGEPPSRALITPANTTARVTGMRTPGGGSRIAASGSSEPP